MRGQNRVGFFESSTDRPGMTGSGSIGPGSSSSHPQRCLFATQLFSHLLLGLLLLLVLFVITLQGSLLFGQASSSADSAASLQVGHDTWTFKEGAPADVACLAQTNDGFLWLGGPNGLFRFDGTRFEVFRSPFGDRLSRNYAAGASMIWNPRLAALRLR
jgi:hypothetical protein